MRRYVVQENSHASPSDSSLIELVQGNIPLLCMQLALLWFGLANTILQCMMSAKFSAAIRRQCLLIATVSTVLDLLVHFNVDPGLEGGASMEENTSFETMNPFAAFLWVLLHRIRPRKEKKTENEEEGAKVQKLLM